MSVAVPIAPRFFVFLAALAASLTLDLLFFFGARGSSASFTFELFFDRGAGGGQLPPRSASARTGRGRAASAATVKAASSRARARAMLCVAVQLLRAARRSSAATPRRASLSSSPGGTACAECHGKSCGDASQAGTSAALASLDYGSIPTPASRLHRYATRTSRFKASSSSVLVCLRTLAPFFCETKACKLLTTRELRLANRFELTVVPP